MNDPEPEPEPEPEPTTQRNDTPDDQILAQAAEEDVVFVDVRTAVEFNGGHLPGAVNLPVNSIDMDSALEAIGEDLARPVIVYCASGNRSARALTALEALGYEDVLDGGGAQALAALLEVELEQ